MDLCVDIETGDTARTAALISIGLVLFDPYSQELGETYLCAIPPSSNDSAPRRTWSGSTMEFWSNNPAALAELATHPQRTLQSFIREFNAFVAKHKPDCIWANSPTFDIAILRDLYESRGYSFPFPFYKERDVRTLKALLPKHLLPELDGTQHNALVDAIHEARLVQAFTTNCYFLDKD